MMRFLSFWCVVVFVGMMPIASWAEGIMRVTPSEVAISRGYVRLTISTWEGVKGVRSVRLCNSCEECASGKAVRGGVRTLVENGEATTDMMLAYMGKPMLYSIEMTYLSKSTGKIITSCLPDCIEVLQPEQMMQPIKENAVVLPSTGPIGEQVRVSVNLPYSISHCRQLSLRKSCESEGDIPILGKDIVIDESGGIQVTFDLKRADVGTYALVGACEKTGESGFQQPFCTENAFEVFQQDHSGRIVKVIIGIGLIILGAFLILKGISIRSAIPEE